MKDVHKTLAYLKTREKRENAKYHGIVIHVFVLMGGSWQHKGTYQKASQDHQRELLDRWTAKLGSRVTPLEQIRVFEANETSVPGDIQRHLEKKHPSQYRPHDIDMRLRQPEPPQKRSKVKT